MNDTRESLVETIRQNPIPAAFAGIGIAWLLMNRSSRQRRGPSQASYPRVSVPYGQPGDARIDRRDSADLQHRRGNDGSVHRDRHV